ncbi:MAG: response regulator [Sideroxydans sp.]|jgi:hypothetical protein
MANLTNFQARLFMAFATILIMSSLTVGVALLGIERIHATHDSNLEHKAPVVVEPMAARGDDIHAMAATVTAQVRSQVLAMLLLTLGVGIGAAWWINRSLRQRVAVLEARSERLARGQFNVDEGILESSKDELAVIELAQKRVAQDLNSFGSQIRDLALASREGDLSRRLDTGSLKGDWGRLAQDVNVILDEAIGPISAQAAALQKMAEGTLTARITEDFRGDHNRIKNAINRVADIATTAMVELDLMIQASRDGDLDKRADVQRFVGDWRIIMNGVNTVLDEAIGPVNAQAAVLQKMAEGTLTARITEDFRGDHNRIKSAVNRVADIAMTAMTELDSMIQASRDGDLDKRADVQRFVGDWRIIMNGVNTVLDEAIGPVNAQAAVLQKMAEGTLTARITEDFRGDHNRIKTAVNQISGIALGALNEFDELIVAFDAGEFERRARAENYLGDWQKIMAGLNQILASVHRTTQQVQAQNWVKTGISELAEQMRGDLALADLARQVVAYLARYVDAQVGALYIWNADERSLQLMGSYAYQLRKDTSSRFAIGEGLVGQAALEKQLISVTELPDDYVRITSGIGETPPRNSLVMPLLYENEIKGVIELGRVRAFEPLTLDLLQMAADAIGVALNTAESSDRTRVLLAQTREQAGQLQMQQEELQQTNEELEEQAQSLKASEEELRTQQEELQQTNEELEERTKMLETQRTEISQKNNFLERAQDELRQQTEDLAIASKYKSEFLANMSHELRTPLNSMLLLSRSLADNKDGNLSEKQVKAADVMYQSGNDLLSIINDILDLSKIEAGREVAMLENVALDEVTGQLDGLYRHVAEDKGLIFTVDVAEGLPNIIHSDRGRLGQILRNLLSNAFKFTAQGGVTLRLARPEANIHYRLPTLQSLANPLENVLAIAVIDTGIGIEIEKQKHIWEAFQQADGSTSRQYGGTGLGLTISRELARLLGGEIHLQSTAGNGATFTLYLPVSGPASSAEPTISHQSATPQYLSSRMPSPRVGAGKKAKKDIRHIQDDRDSIAKDEAAVLIVEDDPNFAQLLADSCREHGMKYLASATAEEAIALLEKYRIHSVMLDMELPEKHGWAVLSSIKEELDTLHIPVYVISADERNQQTLQYGALGFLQKPVSPEQMQTVCTTVRATLNKQVKTVLLVEDNATLRGAVHDLLDADDVSIREVSDGASALQALQEGGIDLVVLDLGLPDMSGFELLERAGARKGALLPPMIVFTGRDLTQDEYEQLQHYAARVIVKGVRSQERLVEEVAIFLHRRVENLPEQARKMLTTLHDKEAQFTGKQVLLVDDDIRNVFSLSGLLEEHGLKVVTARNGQEALDRLAEHPDVDLVLTDIMMPVMDGYEFIRRTRAQKRYGKLPILALTAKAMKEDRDLCLEAGASDYLAKPIDIDRLFSVLRVWLYQ